MHYSILVDIASKVLSWSAGSVLAGGLALLGFQSFLVLPYLDSLETQVVEEKAAQVRSVFEAEATAFARTVEDWAYWDESVRFVRGKNPGFEAANFYPDALVSIQVHDIVYFRADGTPFRSFELAPDGLTLGPSHELPPLVQALKTLIPNAARVGRQGYLRTGEGLVMVAERPIRSEKNPADIAGYLMMVRTLDTPFWDSFQKRMGMAVAPSAISPGLTSQLSMVPSADRTETLVQIPMSDLVGTVSLELNARLPRKLTVTGLGILSEVTWGSFAIVLVISLANLGLIRRYLIRPVKDLWWLTRQLEASRDWSLRATSRSTDEIGELAQGVNSLITSVEDTTARLEQLASSDALTGLANRRNFDAALGLTWRICLREKRPLGFILGDVDQFKKFNDRYGHRMGDACLKAVAQVIQDAALRPSDVKARYGGEEFAVILPNTDLAGTFLVAERIRSQVESLGLVHEDNPGGQVTISLGCVSVLPQTDLPPETAVEAADKLLYLAKAGGRNRVKS